MSLLSRVIGVVAITLCSTSILAAPAVDVRVRTVPSALDPYPTKPRLTFKSDGTLKITVFSDLHYGENAWDVWGPQQDVNSTRLMNTVLSSEKPDFVVLNGDLITGENTFRQNSTVYIDEIVAPLNQMRVPFCSTHGNHDNQVNITHLEEIQREQAHAPLSYTRINPSGGKYGPGTYWVPIYAHRDDFQPALIIWAFDSRAGVSEGANSVPVSDFVDPSIADWIESQTKLMDSVWGPPDRTRGALAFVHIPPNAVQAVWETLNNVTNPGLDDDTLGVGSTQATNNPADAGKDEAFWSSLNANVKNLHAVISGHDHGDEWCAREPTQNVIFCFDKHSGYGGYSEPTWGHGVRNIVFSTPDPAVGPETWIRLEEGETRAHITLNASYV